MSKKLLLVALSLVLPLVVAAQSTCTFTTNTILKRGSTHQDVLIMQRILNLDPATAIAKTGSGSINKENSYFGTLTYNALLKFQSKYAVSVEKGYLGTVTRAKLTQVCSATPVVVKPSNVTLPTISSVSNATTLTLTASNGTWNNTPTSYTYKWLRNGNGITNATYATYTTKAGDNGSDISVRVTATNKAGSASATSLPKRIANPVVAITPVNTALPVISTLNSTTLTTTNGSWSNTPTSYSYQWKRNAVAISGATTATYATTTSDAGTTLTVSVTATNGAGSAVATSLGKAIAAPSVVTYSLSVSKVGSGTIASSGGSINCGTACTTTVSTPISTTLTATPATGYTFSGWSGGACSGTSPSCTFTIDGVETVIATFTASVSQPTSSVTLDDFSGSRLNSGLGADIISLYAGEDPGQSLSISNGLLSVTGSPTNGIYWQFQPYPYTGSLGFTKGWIESGVWNQDANRLKFSFMCDANVSKTSSGYGNVQFGTYVKKDDGNGTNQGAHYYHHIDPNIYSGKWINVDINRTPQHQVGMAADTNWSEDPIWNSGTGVHYFDGLTRFYFDTQGAGFSGVNCKFTPIKFTNVSGEPDQQISSVTYQYTGSRYEVTWSGQKNSSLVYDVVYSPSSMKVNGFSSGTNGGTVSATGNTYTNVIWTSPSIAQNTNGMYVAVRPQGQSSFTEVYVPYVAASTPTTYSLALTTTSGAGYITGTGITTCTSSCTSNLSSGTSITLTAIPVTGYTFSGWTGACSGTATTCTVSMTSAKTVGATFTQVVVTTPTISGVSGTIQTGQTLTITGSSMVEENRTSWDPFFTTRTNASGFEGTNLLADYGNSLPCHSYDTSMKLMGSKSLRISDSGASSVTNHGGCEFDFVPQISSGTGPNDAYFRVYSRWNNNEWPNEIIKYWWLGGSPKAAFLNLIANGGNAPTQLGFTQTDYNNGTMAAFTLPDGALQNNKWYLFELRVQKHVSTGTYQYEAWVDNKLVFSVTSTSGVSPNSAGWGFASNVNYWSTSPSFVSDQWQDGFVVASSRVGPASLIEISNNSTYGAGTTAYQSPVYLSDGSVQVTANLTGLGSGPYYLWVTNSGKARSQPYSLGSATPTTYSLALTTTSGAGYITGTGITTCTSSCTSNLSSGTSITLTAIPVTGYTFSGWTGACSGTATTCTVSMTSAKTVGATFTQMVTSTSFKRIFFDGFEANNTNQWTKDGIQRNKCTVVTSSTDGVQGTHSGSYMARCADNGTVAWNAPDSYETMAPINVSDSNQFFVRAWVRKDQNVDTASSAGSPKKLLRFFNWNEVQSTYNDLFGSINRSSGLSNEGVTGGTSLTTYWGGATGDTTNSPTSWHKIEYYINKQNGNIKVWHDGVLVRNDTGRALNNAQWLPYLYIASNWSDTHDATNHFYFDDIEIYSDASTGTTATGQLSDASVSVSSVSTPTTPTVGDSGNQLYVSPSGNDAVTRANNSINNPWKTLTHAMYNLQAGDTLNIRGGTTNPIIYTPAYPTILRSDYSSKTYGGDPNETMNAQTGTVSAPVVIRAYPGELVTIDAQNKDVLINLDDKSHWTFNGFKIINARRAFYVGENGTASNNTFQNLDITMSMGGDNYGAITLAGASTEGAKIHNNKIVGPPAPSCLISNVTGCTHGNTAGLFVNRIENLTITNNEISRAPIGIYYKHSNFGSGTNIKIANNYIYDTSRNSIQLNARYAVVENNIIGLNSGSLLFAEANGNPGGDYNTVTHNTVLSGGLYLPYETQSMSFPPNYTPVPDAIPGSIGNILKDNIIIPGMSIHLYQSNPHNTIMDYNLYGGTIKTFTNPNPGYTRDAWYAFYGQATGQDMHSTGGTPTFIGGASPSTIQGFTLSTGSPGIGSGSLGSNMGANPTTVGPK